MKSGEDLQIISLTRALLKKALENNTYWNSSAKDIPFSTSKACVFKMMIFVLLLLRPIIN